MSESHDWQERYGSALMNTFGPPKLVLVRGEGCHVWDADGKEYVDFLGGIAVNSLGHNHPALVSAVTEQLQTLGHISNFFTSPQQVELAERLRALVRADAKIFLTNSGTEANEAALKLTRRTGRTHLVAAEGGFHGRTMGSLALTSKATYREPFEPLPGDVTFVPYGDVNALANAVTDQTAAVVLEPVQGEAGVIPAPAGYLEAARQITQQQGALLWLDEVQTGIGRTGAWFNAADRIGADIVTLAKGLGGGIPIGACLAIGPAKDLFEPGNHGTTFGGNPVACAAALAVLKTIEADGLLHAALQAGERLKVGLLKDTRVLDVRGSGLLLGVELKSDTSGLVAAAAMENGFIVNAPTPSALRLAPALTIGDHDIDALVAAWPKILDDSMGAVR